MMVMIVFILSCKKQNQTFEKNTVYSPTEMKPYNQLVSFNEKIRSDLKTQTFLEADSAIWYLEALFNVQNGYPDSCSESTMSVDLNYTLSEGIAFMTQSQIDSFQINHPNCTKIEGHVLGSLSQF